MYKSWFQNLNWGFLMSSMKVISSPHGWGLFTISLSNKTLQGKTIRNSRIIFWNRKTAPMTEGPSTCKCLLLPGYLLLDCFRDGLGKQIEHCTAEVVCVAVWIPQLISNGVQEQISTWRYRRFCNKYAIQPKWLKHQATYDLTNKRNFDYPINWRH